MEKNDLEGMLRTLLATTQGANMSDCMGKLRTALETDKGQAVIRQLGSDSGSDTLKEAVQAAASGDRNRAMQLVQALMGTPDGARMVALITELLK